nr:MFS transporter [Verrucomicrobium sp. GAS474]
MPALPSSPPDRDPYLAFRHRSYRLFFGGRLLFQVGNQMQVAAIGWLVYERFGTTMALAYVGLVQVIPVFFGVLPAGHLADRLDRRKILLVSQSIFFCCSLALGLLSLLGGPPVWMYPILFVMALGRVFALPAVSSLVPLLIPRESLANATTWTSTLIELSGLIGPALGGAIIAFSGSATPVFFLTTGCALLCIPLFASLPLREQPGLTAGGVAGVSWEWDDLLSGFRFILKNRLLLAAACLDLFATLFGGVMALLPVVAKDLLHAGPEGFGWLRAAPSFGAVAMAVVTTHLPPWRRSGRVLFFAVVGFGLAVIVFGFSTSFWLSFAMLVLTGVFDNINVVIRQTLIQYITPEVMRGRIMAINFFCVGTSNELGAFESGLAARLFGTVPSIVLGGVGTFLAVAAVMRLSPGLRRLGPLHEVKAIPHL